MMHQRGFWVVLAALVAGGGLVLVGNADNSVSLTAATEVWADVLRDVDQFGLSVTRVTDAEETALGKRLAASMFGSGEAPDAREAYVAAVGRLVEPHVRRKGIAYTFRVVPGLAANAMALPGGQVFITAAMLDAIESEAELASVLAHEMAHVDQRHCIEQYQTRVLLGRIDLEAAGAVPALARGLVMAGYRKYQEVEADAAGQRLVVAAGYDPQGAIDLMQRLLTQESGFHSPSGRASRNPLEEILDETGEALGGYFESHPGAEERIERLRQLERSRQFWSASRTFAIGRENKRRGVTVAEETFPGETTPPK